MFIWVFIEDNFWYLKSPHKSGEKKMLIKDSQEIFSLTEHKMCLLFLVCKYYATNRSGWLRHGFPERLVMPSAFTRDTTICCSEKSLVKTLHLSFAVWLIIGHFLSKCIEICHSCSTLYVPFIFMNFDFYSNFTALKLSSKWKCCKWQ